MTARERSARQDLRVSSEDEDVVEDVANIPEVHQKRQREQKLFDSNPNQMCVQSNQTQAGSKIIIIKKNKSKVRGLGNTWKLS